MAILRSLSTVNLAIVLALNVCWLLVILVSDSLQSQRLHYDKLVKIPYLSLSGAAWPNLNVCVSGAVEGRCLQVG
jgi:hypothetical protein